MPATLVPNIVVPATADAGVCRSCTRKIFWIVTPKNRRMPVDCTIPGAYEPVRANTTGPVPVTPRDGVGVSHFATCPNAAQHSKRGRS